MTVPASSSNVGMTGGAPEDGRVGIVDIGSNSIRLVVYDGPRRIPSILFNEKVMAGLGKSLAATGRLDPQAVERAFSALARFRHVARAMDVTTLHTVATAAVREAENGADFLARAVSIGLDVTLLSGVEEAEMSGAGVIAAFPDADGIVGDLGGGSLELVRVRGGAVAASTSFPLGVLRLGSMAKGGPRSIRQKVRKAFAGSDWVGAGRGLPFYLVGGSWRALARVVMHRTGYPLPIVHGFPMSVAAVEAVSAAMADGERGWLKAVPGLSGSRAATLPEAAALLTMVADELGVVDFLTSAWGLREGVLYAKLPAGVRADDPLICATREEGRRQGRFPEHGDLLHRWIAPLFEREDAADARLRHATCLLADVGWRAHPEFRAERGVETALHGNWVGIDARGRAIMAQALWTSFGATEPLPICAALAGPDDLRRAERWGLAIRLGQRLSGGVAGPLRASRLEASGDTLALWLPAADAPLYGEAVERRHRTLATAMARRPEFVPE